MSRLIMIRAVAAVSVLAVGLGLMMWTIAPSDSASTLAAAWSCSAALQSSAGGQIVWASRKANAKARPLAEKSRPLQALRPPV